MAYGISWLAWLPYVLSTDGLSVFAFTLPKIMGNSQLAGLALGAYLGPLTSAFIVTAVTEGKAGLRHWRGRLFRWKVGLRWYLVVLLGVPAAIVVGTLAVPGAIASLHLPSLGILPIYAAFLLFQMVTSSLSEEPGWRDFALPRLQEKYGALPGTLVLGVLWGGWHLPLFLTTWGSGATGLALLQFLILAVLLSISMTWVFNNAKESLPLVMLFHATFNAFLYVVWPQIFPHLDSRWNWGPVIGMAVVAALLIWATRGRLGTKIS
jgi:membrane protease YdiL (CAAX protease family)